METYLLWSPPPLLSLWLLVDDLLRECGEFGFDLLYQVQL